jgi:hypothetical protein
MLERAARLKRATDLKNAQQQFERSHEGTAKANAGYEECSRARLFLKGERAALPSLPCKGKIGLPVLPLRR